MRFGLKVHYEGFNHLNVPPLPLSFQICIAMYGLYNTSNCLHLCSLALWPLKLGSSRTRTHRFLLFHFNLSSFLFLRHAPGASFQFHAGTCKSMKPCRCSLDVCFFWLTVAGPHFGSIEVNLHPLFILRTRSKFTKIR